MSISARIFLTLMVASLAGLGYQVVQLSSQVQTLERVGEVASVRLRRQDRETRDQFRQLSEVLATVQPAAAAAPSQINQQLQVVVAQLLLVESERLDHLVRWIDLVEEKIFLLLATGGDPSEREVALQGIRAKSDQLRASFASASRQSAAIRRQLSSGPQPMR